MKMQEVERKYAQQAFQSVDIDGTFTGYASIFDAIDLGNESVAKGAFLQSINRKKNKGIKLLFQHNPDEPIGHWIDIKEDKYGLFVKGQLDLNVARAREVHSLMKQGSIDGLSIGFKTIRSCKEKGGQIRRILEADLWEISIVTFPMLPQARVNQVKSHSVIPSKREFERWLVRDAGLSRSQAKVVIVKGYTSLLDVRDAGHLSNKHKKSAQLGLAQKIRQAARCFQIQ